MLLSLCYPNRTHPIAPVWRLQVLPRKNVGVYLFSEYWLIVRASNV